MLAGLSPDQLVEPNAAESAQRRSSSALAVEVTDDSARKFNEDLIRGACGQLGEMQGDMLKVVSLAGSQSVSSGIGDGRLNPELVECPDPALAEHACTGLVWDVLSREVVMQWPAFAGLVQSATNATLQKQESELQLLQRVHGLIASADNADFAAKKAALASKPPCGACLPRIYEFALKFLSCVCHYIAVFKVLFNQL